MSPTRAPDVWLAGTAEPTGHLLRCIAEAIDGSREGLFREVFIETDSGTMQPRRSFVLRWPSGLAFRVNVAAIEKRPRKRSPGWGLVKYTVTGVDGDSWTVTLAEYLRDNSDLPRATIDAIRLLSPGETYRGGGGAAPVWSITRQRQS